MLQRTFQAKFVRRYAFLVIAWFAFTFLGIGFMHRNAHAQTGGGTRLLRNPTVSATQIAFAYAQNIWTVPRAGGTGAGAEGRGCRAPRGGGPAGQHLRRDAPTAL